MAYFYILKSERNGRYYVGSTKDINRRIQEHFSGKHLSSRRLLPLRVVFQQEFSDINIARKAERKIKQFKRRDFIEKIVRDGYFYSVDS